MNSYIFEQYPLFPMCSTGCTLNKEALQNCPCKCMSANAVAAEQTLLPSALEQQCQVKSTQKVIGFSMARHMHVLLFPVLFPGSASVVDYDQHPGIRSCINQQGTIPCEVKNKLNRVILESCQTRSFTCHASPSKSDQHVSFSFHDDRFVPL
jgi:hypothetical protein